MDWTTVDFTGITTGIENMLPELIVPAIAVFALVLAVKLAPRILRSFAK